MGLSTTALVTGLSRVLAARKRGEMTGDEMRRQRTEHDEDRAREIAHAALEEQMARGTLSDRDTARQYQTTRRQQVADAAAKLRQNPRYKSIWDLPDDELVQEAGRLAVERERPSYANYGNVQQNRRLGAVSAQVDDTRADLSAARRAVPKGMPFSLAAEPTAADSAKFRTDSTAAAGRVTDLQSRADSLSAVRDSLAAVVEGRPVGPIGGGANSTRPVAKRRVSSDQRDYLQSIGKWDPNRYEVIETYGPPQ